MLVFKSRRRVSPALRTENTPSENRVARNLVKARKEVTSWIDENITAVMDAVAHKPWTEVADMIPDGPWRAFQKYLEEELLAEVVAAGVRTTNGPVGKAATPLLGYRFDATRPEASEWASREAANMVTDITTGQRDTIRDLISRGQMEGITVDQTARTIRQTVGLTTEQAGWVDNFYGRALSDNIRAGMSPSQAAARASSATSRYHDQIHRYRSETIARTEIARAANEGRQLAWDQGIAQGFISPLAEKEWIAEADACDICSPRNGQRHPAGKEWPDGDPPAHPNCRCDLLLVPPSVVKPTPDRSLVQTLGGFFPTEYIPGLIGRATFEVAWRGLFAGQIGGRSERAARFDYQQWLFERNQRPQRATIYEARSYQERTGVRSFTRTERDSFTLLIDGEEVPVRTVARYRGTKEITEIFERGGIDTPLMYELHPSEAKLFHRMIKEAKDRNKYGASVELYDVEDYAGMRLFINRTGRAGFAIKDGDELVSVYRGDTPLRGAADWMVHLAIEQGARRADAFDTVLPFIYGDHGLVVVARTAWNDAFAPPGWDKRLFSAYNAGEPDVVFMVYNRNNFSGYYSPVQGVPFGKNDYDLAYGFAKRFLQWLNTVDGAASRAAPTTDPLFIGMPRVITFDRIVSRADDILYHADAALGDRDPVLKQIYKMRGYDALPVVIDSPAFNDLVADGSRLVLYRGIDGPPEHFRAFRYGDYFAGIGNSGNGTYSTLEWNYALLYATGNPQNLFRMTLQPNARVIDSSDVFRLLVEYQQSPAWYALSDNARKVLNNPGRFAAALGYDAIRVVSGVGKHGPRDHVIILNRGAVIVDKNNGFGPGTVDIQTLNTEWLTFTRSPAFDSLSEEAKDRFRDVFYFASTRGYDYVLEMDGSVKDISWVRQRYNT